MGLELLMNRYFRCCVAVLGRLLQKVTLALTVLHSSCLFAELHYFPEREQSHEYGLQQ